MAEKRTRYNELLDVPNSIRDPDLYQLLGLDRSAFDPEAVDGSYRQQMSKLQAIRSPKHKSFIEFLKGELRNARLTLTNAQRRQAYDGELLEERREQLARILDVVLADGELTPAEEERIHQVALDVGLLPHETEQLLADELAGRGAARAAPEPEPQPEPQPAPQPAAPAPAAVSLPAPAPVEEDEVLEPLDPSEALQLLEPKLSKSSQTNPALPAEPRAPVDSRTPSPSDIQRAIARRMKPTGRRPPRPTLRAPAKPAAARPRTAKPKPKPKPKPRPTPAPVDSTPPNWAQTARPARQTGWGKASVVRQVGVCAGCLEPVNELEIQRGKAERVSDGRLHCPTCTNRLVAGLICGTCYQPITRAEMKASEFVIRASRVMHGRCAPR